MRDVPQEFTEIDDDQGLGDFLDLDSNEEYPLPETDDPQGDEQTEDENVGTKNGPDYLELAKKVYAHLDAPAKFIRCAAAILVHRDALQDPRCNTNEREAMIHEGLGACVDAALTELIVDASLRINQVSALALEIRALAPEIFDAWVRLQFMVGRPLAMVTAKRNGFDLARERFIEDQLKEGKLAAGAIMSVAPQFENFVGIARLTFEQDLNIQTVDEQLELDLALNNFITARRISFMAQSLISPAGPNAKDLTEGLKLLAQVQKLDKSYQLTIDRMRARNRRKSKTVQLAVRKRITVAVTATTEESDGREAISA